MEKKNEKKKPIRQRQLGIRLKGKPLEDLEYVCDTLDMEITAFIKLMLAECLPVYLKRANNVKEGKMPEL